MNIGINVNPGDTISGDINNAVVVGSDGKLFVDKVDVSDFATTNSLSAETAERKAADAELGENISTHINDADRHVSLEDRERWEAAVDGGGVQSINTASSETLIAVNNADAVNPIIGSTAALTDAVDKAATALQSSHNTDNEAHEDIRRIVDGKADIEDKIMAWRVSGQPPTSRQWTSIATGNGVTIAIAQENTPIRRGHIARSLDGGETWEEVQSSSAAEMVFRNIAYGDGVFIIYAYRSDYPMGKVFLRSVDGGVVWEPISFEFSVVDATIMHICYGGGVWLATAGTYIDHLYARSLDGGITWTEIGSIPYQINLNTIAYGGGIFLFSTSGNYRVLVSLDLGLTWVRRILTISYVTGGATLAYGNDGVWVGVSNYGIPIRTLDNFVTVEVATDAVFPVATTNVMYNPADNSFLGIVYNNSESNIAYRSIDNGKTWIEATMPVLAVWIAAAFDGKNTIAVARAPSTIVAIGNIFTLPIAAHVTNTVMHITEPERTNWNSKAADTASLSAETGDGVDTTTGAVGSGAIQTILQAIWGKIRQVVNAMVRLTGAQTVGGVKTFSDGINISAVSAGMTAGINRQAMSDSINSGIGSAAFLWHTATINNDAALNAFRQHLVNNTIYQKDVAFIRVVNRGQSSVGSPNSAVYSVINLATMQRIQASVLESVSINGDSFIDFYLSRGSNTEKLTDISATSVDGSYVLAVDGQYQSNGGRFQVLYARNSSTQATPRLGTYSGITTCLFVPGWSLYEAGIRNPDIEIQIWKRKDATGE
jgi:hypothetical protein